MNRGWLIPVALAGLTAGWLAAGDQTADDGSTAPAASSSTRAPSTCWMVLHGARDVARKTDIGETADARIMTLAEPGFFAQCRPLAQGERISGCVVTLGEHAMGYESWSDNAELRRCVERRLKAARYPLSQQLDVTTFSGL